MEKHKQTLYTLLIGMCIGVVIILAVLVLSGNVPWLKAAGVGTGAPDVNARYLDGYGTSLSAAATKIYISGADNYLPDNTVVSTTLVDGTALAEILDDDGTGSGLDADLLDSHNSDYFSQKLNITCHDATCTGAGCWANVCCPAGKTVMGGYLYDDRLTTVCPTGSTLGYDLKYFINYSAINKKLNNNGTNCCNIRESDADDEASCYIICGLLE